MQRRHVNRTVTQMDNFRAAIGNPQRERDALKSWLGSIKELLDNEMLTEILVYIYSKPFPNEQAVVLLNKQEVVTKEIDHNGHVRFL